MNVMIMTGFAINKQILVSSVSMLRYFGFIAAADP